MRGAAGLALLAAAVATCLLLIVGIHQVDDPEPTPVVAAASIARGERAIEWYGCGTCHTIPGVRGADARVGPPLDHWAERSFIAGKVSNLPPNLMRWLRDPQKVAPGNAMPDVGLSRRAARDIAAYLFSLR